MYVPFDATVVLVVADDSQRRVQGQPREAREEPARLGGPPLDHPRADVVLLHEGWGAFVRAKCMPQHTVRLWRTVRASRSDNSTDKKHLQKLRVKLLSEVLQIKSNLKSICVLIVHCTANEWFLEGRLVIRASCLTTKKLRN